MYSIVEALVNNLCDPSMSSTDVIPWGSPVPSFGDPSKATVATLGLNPSNREFVDEQGLELTGSLRRFHTLSSLGLSGWGNITSKHLEAIVESCCSYFCHNPYDAWFRQLDYLISGATASYYDWNGNACHLDLIPYATKCKWTHLSSAQKSILLNVAGDALTQIINDSPIRLLVLNGRTVVEGFQEMARVTLAKRLMPAWALKRGGQACVDGYSFMGRIRRIKTRKLDREILVLGFNHNIQSSFGVTKEVRSGIRSWISKEAAGLNETARYSSR